MLIKSKTRSIFSLVLFVLKSQMAQGMDLPTKFQGAPIQDTFNIEYYFENPFSAVPSRYLLQPSVMVMENPFRMIRCDSNVVPFGEKIHNESLNKEHMGIFKDVVKIIPKKYAYLNIRVLQDIKEIIIDPTLIEIDSNMTGKKILSHESLTQYMESINTLLSDLLKDQGYEYTYNPLLDYTKQIDALTKNFENQCRGEIGEFVFNSEDNSPISPIEKYEVSEKDRQKIIEIAEVIALDIDIPGITDTLHYRNILREFKSTGEMKVDILNSYFLQPKILKIFEEFKASRKKNTKTSMKNRDNPPKRRMIESRFTGPMREMLLNMTDDEGRLLFSMLERLKISQKMGIIIPGVNDTTEYRRIGSECSPYEFEFKQEIEKVYNFFEISPDMRDYELISLLSILGKEIYDSLENLKYLEILSDNADPCLKLSNYLFQPHIFAKYSEFIHAQRIW